MSDDFDPTKVTWVLNDVAMERLLIVLAQADEITWDLETTGLDEFRPNAKIALASFTLPNEDTWLLPLYHPESPFIGTWREKMTRAAQALIGKYLMAHNGKFDCRWIFHHCGVDLASWLMWDSAISSHSLDENRSSRLKVRAPETFDIPPWDDFDLSKDEAALHVPLIDLGLYAARDTFWTQRLCRNHRERMFLLDPEEPPHDPEEIEDARLGKHAMYCGMPTIRTLTKVEQRGILLDVPFTLETKSALEATRDELYETLGSAYPEVLGNPSFAPTSHYFRRWTEAAVEKGDLRIAALTKTGKPQWSKGVLVRQAREGQDLAQKILDYRSAVKRLEYVNSWLAHAQSDGLIHASYNAGSVVTGRLSSSSPNMQQVTKPLRPCFIPRPGYYIGELDYSQIELRAAAHIANCRPMIEAFVQGLDLHRMIAASITGKPEDEVLPDERQKGKAANFGFLFGQTAYGFRFYAEDAYDVSMTEREAEEAYAAFFDRWDGMAAWHARSIARAQREGQVVSPIGRVRRVPGIWSPHEGAANHAEKSSINSPVQGFASDMMQIAAASIEGTLPGSEPISEVSIVASVHDSIVVEVPIESWEESTRACIDRMTDLNPILRRMDCELTVPLAVEANVGSRWGLSDIGTLV